MAIDIREVIRYIFSLILAFDTFVTALTLASMWKLQSVETKLQLDAFLNEAGYVCISRYMLMCFLLVKSYYETTKLATLEKKAKQSLLSFLVCFLLIVMRYKTLKIEWSLLKYYLQIRCSPLKNVNRRHYQGKYRKIIQIREVDLRFWIVLPFSLYQYSHDIVNNHRTPEELMHYEWARYLSFKTFPQEAPVSPLRLAQAGFYYTGRDQEVKCFSCGLTNGNHTRDETPMQVHGRLSPSCNWKTSNVTIHSSDYYSDNIQQRDSVCNPEHEFAVPTHTRPPNAPVSLSRQNSQPQGSDATQNESQSSTNLSVTTCHVKYPQYRDRSARSASFEGWKLGSLISPDDLAEAGFFYAGMNDFVRCFCCGVGLKDWDAEDIPLTEHARWSPKCHYLQELGHSLYSLTPNQRPQPDLHPNLLWTINSGQKREKEELQKRVTELEKRNEKLEKENKCKICLDAEADTVLLPCGHMFCSECASKLRSCGVCRKYVKELIRVYKA